MCSIRHYKATSFIKTTLKSVRISSAQSDISNKLNTNVPTVPNRHRLSGPELTKICSPLPPGRCSGAMPSTSMQTWRKKYLQNTGDLGKCHRKMPEFGGKMPELGWKMHENALFHGLDMFGSGNFK